MRKQKTKSLEEDIAALNKQIAFKQKRLEQAETVRRYEQYEMINSEIQEVRAKKRGLELELAEFQKKEKKARWYQGREKAMTPKYLHQMRVMFPPCTTGNSAGRPVLELVHRLIARTSHPTPFERHSDSVCVYVVTQSYLLKSVQLLFPDIVKYSTQ